MRPSTRRTILTLLFGFLVLGSLGFSWAAASPSLPGAHGTGLSAPQRAALPLAGPHGDLVVSAANSPFVISPATTGSTTYVQEGNITVLAGGTLVVRDETLDFLQFISDPGTLAARILHIYHFSDQGTVTLANSTVTTDTTVINAYPKLTLNISAGGAMTLASSALQFPGWVSVYGAGSSLTLNNSLVSANPRIPKLAENISILGDTSYAPSLSVGAGAHFSALNSTLTATYKDNPVANLMPGPAPLNDYAPYVLDPSTSQTIASWPMATDSENVTRALLYPSFAGGSLGVGYATNNTVTSSGNTFTFGGTTYPLPAITFHPGINEEFVPLPAAALTAINAVGPTGWLEATGSFDQAGTIQVHLGATGGGYPVNVELTSLALTPVLDYNLTVTGAGSTFTAADSSLDLSWNLTPGTPVSSGQPVPTPWGSNKVLLAGGAAAYLANVTVPTSRSTVFFATSAVLPDAASHAYFYRWASIPVVSGASVPISEAQATAYYSYDSSQSNNATATSLNNLASADPALAGYVSAWDAAHGVLAYGQSGADGVASLLLAATELDQANLPDGTFLGGYHVSVTLSGGGNGSSQWGYVAVSPYPSGMSPATPDLQNPFVYANYAPALDFTGTSIVVAGQPQTNAVVAIGQPITFSTTVSNVGTGPVQTFTINLSYALPAPLASTLLNTTKTLGPLAAGAQQTVDLTWIVNESVTGDHGYFTGHFNVLASWNGGLPPDGGAVVQTFDVAIQPAFLTLTFTPPPGELQPSVSYLGNGTVHFNGSGDAAINIYGVAPNGAQYLLAQQTSKSGAYSLNLVTDPTMPAGSYTVLANATYNGRSVQVSIANAFTIPSPPTTSPPFWEQKILGLPILYWIIIAAAIVGGILAFLFVARRTARGKLVECGECGALIPETATQCPQCGAEFENDLVRCSRCGSTIPSDAKVCPECAAQLLGAPEEEARDPERQGYADVVERFRAEAKKELGENYSEGAFWDWWKRQPTYLSFSQWRLQQSQGSRAGMGAPPEEEAAPARPPARPPKGGAPPAAAARPAVARPAAPAPARAAAPPPRAVAPAPVAPTTPAPAAPAGTPSAAMKACSNCGKEIPPDYLVCPFCGAVTQ